MMAWDVKRARQSERRWKLLAVALGLIPVVIVAALAAMPYWWSWTAWNQKVAAAENVAPYTEVAVNAPFAEVEAKLGKPLYSGPGFESRGLKQAGVYYWRTDAGEVRALVIRDRVVGRPKVGEW